jgi:DNA ligase-associated metallophosphoesterase
MTAPIPYTIQEQCFWLTTERGIFWEKESALILSDLHFGKTGHFRKNGIGVPHAVYKEDLQRMVDLISFFQPKKMIAVGDLFHSADNLELQLFSKIRTGFSNMDLILVQGNHDILEKNWYQRNHIELVNSNYCLNNFNFVHDPSEIPPDNQAFYFSGHLHPSISISGMGKQSLSFPCYYFTEHSAILPAFSKFSGTAKVKKKKTNRIIAIVENSLIEIEK